MLRYVSVHIRVLQALLRNVCNALGHLVESLRKTDPYGIIVYTCSYTRNNTYILIAMKGMVKNYFPTIITKP